MNASIVRRYRPRRLPSQGLRTYWQAVPETVVVTQKGDRLVDLTKRVYAIADPDRALTIALTVAAMTARNRSALASRVGLPLEAGLSIDFPAWESVQDALKAHEARRKSVESRVSAGPPMRPSAMALAPRAVGIVRQTPLGERTMTRDLVRALGANASTLVAELRPLGEGDVDPTRTQSALVSRVVGFGRKLALELSRGTLVELFSQSERGFAQAFELMLRQANPRAFTPSVDAKPTLVALFSGFFSAIAERMIQETKAELERRHALLERAVARVDVAKLPQGRPASMIFGADGAAALAALKAALQEAVPLTQSSGIREQVIAQYGISNSVMRDRFFLPPLPSEVHRLLRFLDLLQPGTTDGTLAERILSLATRVSEAHRLALQHASELLSRVELDEGIVAPNEALTAALPGILRELRERRSGASPEEQNLLLADERHLLSGRNFVSFRKDIAAHLDLRVSLAVALTQRQRVGVVLALFLQDGHRFAAMRKEDMDAAVGRLLLAVG